MEKSCYKLMQKHRLATVVDGLGGAGEYNFVLFGGSLKKVTLQVIVSCRYARSSGIELR